MQIKRRLLALTLPLVLGLPGPVAQASDNDRGKPVGFNIKALKVKPPRPQPAERRTAPVFPLIVLSPSGSRGGGGFEIAMAVAGGGGIDVSALTGDGASAVPVDSLNPLAKAKVERR